MNDASTTPFVPLTEQELAELEKLDCEATPPPWEYDGMHNEIQTPQGDGYWLIVSECRSAPDQKYLRKDSYDANFALIAKQRNLLSRMIAEIRFHRV